MLELSEPEWQALEAAIADALDRQDCDLPNYWAATAITATRTFLNERKG